MKVKITQIKSSIGYREKTKKTMIALGLKGINQSVVKELNPSTKGMLFIVNHLVNIEEIK